MPIVSGTKASTTLAANVVMSKSYFPRAKRWIYPRLSSSYISVKSVEPHAVVGAVPPLQQYTGTLKLANIPSYKMQVPNLLFKNAFGIKQSELEFDQTRTLVQLAPQMGVRTAEFPDMLFAKRLLSGTTANSQYVTFEGTQYTQTLDAKPLFATDHPTGKNGASQSNIISGNLPSTKAALLAQDLATSAFQMISDFNALLDAIKQVVDTAGVPLFPSIDPKESIVIVVPPVLEAVAQLAFRTPAPAVISQTTNIMPSFVKDVISHGYLGGLPDPESEVGATVSPTNETDWYAFITDDYVKPFYTQFFRPAEDSDLFPPGYNAKNLIERVVAAVKGITVEQATVFASTRIDTTFGKIGANSDAFTIQTETFLVSARMRGNMVYGPHFLSWKVKPNGGS